MPPGGTAHPMTQPLAQLIPEAASLSPNGAWVAVGGDTGCEASYVYVAPATGGAPRVVFGRSATDPFAANYSTLLGWSADGRIVVRFTPQHCDTPRPRQLSHRTVSTLSTRAHWRARSWRARPSRCGISIRNTADRGSRSPAASTRVIGRSEIIGSYSPDDARKSCVFLDPDYEAAEVGPGSDCLVRDIELVETQR
jgi:hypothetical protein